MEKGKKGRRPFPVLRPPSSLLKPAYPTTLPAQTAPHHADQPYDRISTTHGTIAARAVSFHGQLISGVTPLQLAQNGLYYKPLGPNNRAACCFACGTTTPLTAFLRAPIEEIPRLHTENCMWQIIYRDLKSHFENPDPVSQSTTTSAKSTPTHHHLPSNRLPPKATISNLSIQYERSPAAGPTTFTRPPPTLLPQPQLSQQAGSPHPLQLAQTATSPPQLQKPTYASVIQRAPTSSAQPTSKTHQPAPPFKFTLTIEDLHRRFHNKPPPFKDDKKTRKHPANRARNKPASETHSLARFLHSALPAFSRFLSEMQPNPDSRYPSHLKFHNSRAMKAA
ncbi:uncharacterized protein N7506_005411 [Penicillium brevicompactum]|uniref:uncharacterized protein n=1 Tax=Penicillium brevicompactum TaxID=5074 RepID=UPI00254196D4|nr:uncharacterized protein N7506_005411 [Penicillium brevicompactum]KAJ5337389.1 hypothetical protein N7506_005411 [Penicillium brevicompactum]